MVVKIKLMPAFGRAVMPMALLAAMLLASTGTSNAITW